MKKKNIEKVFREKLQDFSQIPDEVVWENISASLDSKQKKRRVLPIWWQLGGAAALLIIALFVFLPGTDSEPDVEEVITNTESKSRTQEAGRELNSSSDNELKGSDNFEDPDKAIVVSTEKSTDETSKQRADSPGEEVKRGIDIINTSRANEKPEEFPISKNNSALIAEADKEKELISRENAMVSDDPDTYRSIADQAKGISGVEKGELQGEERDSFVSNTVGKKEKEEVKPEELNEHKKQSILEAIAQQEEEITEEISENKWELGPRIAPVFFSSLAQGSPIHSSFRDNAKSGNVNMSYGLNVSYELGKKIKIRSGIHKVDFGYDTKDVTFSSSLNANTNGIINNIDYSLSSRNLVVRSNTRSGKLPTENAQDVAGPDPALNGKMVQEFGYLEVPLELSYEILDNKFGLNLIGGLSSLFLVNNSVTLEADGILTEMGEANNLNDLNLSTNFGVGVSYRFNDKLQLNLEPMFKYQLNTFSETSGNFQPFSMGVYSGLNFRF
ncbi:outer membrane beta-barrel protein [Muriicola sp. SD30]|uniref:outer membrane beta-barrel protein n=1 Tax=Muriicola sp. SD30 TaxID=3240936 RepID=UPI00350F455E